MKKVVITLLLALAGVSSVSAMDADEMALIEMFQEEREEEHARLRWEEEQQKKIDDAASRVVTLLRQRGLLRDLVTRQVHKATEYAQSASFCCFDDDDGLYLFIQGWQGRHWYKLVPAEDHANVFNVSNVHQPEGAYLVFSCADLAHRISRLKPRTGKIMPIILEGDESGEDA